MLRLSLRMVEYRAMSQVTDIDMDYDFTIENRVGMHLLHLLFIRISILNWTI